MKPTATNLFLATLARRVLAGDILSLVVAAAAVVAGLVFCFVSLLPVVGTSNVCVCVCVCVQVKEVRII